MKKGRSAARPGPSHNQTRLRSVFFDDDVAFLDQERSKASFPLGEDRFRNLASEVDPVDLGDVVENGDRGTIAQKDSLGVDSNGIIHGVWSLDCQGVLQSGQA